MRIDIVTIFPEPVRAMLDTSIVGRAQEEGLVAIDVHDLRDETTDRRRTVDDTPYGGGAGMVLKPEPVFSAVEKWLTPAARVILLTPQGRTLTQSLARELAQEEHLILICGRYEGFDERIREHLATDEISIGDFVLTGGELAAMVVADTVVRLIPGVLGNSESAQSESFEKDLLEYPQYTRPPEFRGWSVPEVLLSGNHAEIAKWRLARQEDRTRERRPDMWGRYLSSKKQES
jgi:tRNA (guanine37-N1)-methyltransferase